MISIFLKSFLFIVLQQDGRINVAIDKKSVKIYSPIKSSLQYDKFLLMRYLIPKNNMSKSHLGEN